MNINATPHTAQSSSSTPPFADFAASTRQRWSRFSQCVSGLFSQLHVQCPMCLSVQVEEDESSTFDSIRDLNPELGVASRPIADANADAYVNFWLSQSPGRLSDNDIYAARNGMHKYFQQNYRDQRLSTTEIEALYKSSFVQQPPSSSTESIQSAPEVAPAQRGGNSTVLDSLKNQLKAQGLEGDVFYKQLDVLSELKQHLSTR